MNHPTLRPLHCSFHAALGLTLAMSSGTLCAQNAGLPSAGPALNWTTQQDHQNMMNQLGIKALRPGPSGREGQPNSANYDPAKANPFPDLPEVLT